MEISINVSNKRAALTDSPVIVCGNSDYTVNFNFDSEWDGAEGKTARFVFVREGTWEHIDVELSDDVAVVPVLEKIKEVFVGAYAGEELATTAVSIPCEFSIRCAANM